MQMAELYQGKFSGEEIDNRLDNVKRTCRFVIGTSTAGWTEADCDYLCDGTADDIEINAAIQTLPETGGEIVILDGTYNITAPITVNKNGATLCGHGIATILQRNWDSLVNEGVINITAVNGGVTVQNIQIDGNTENYKNPRNYGIYIISDSNNVVNNICNNNSASSICSDSSNNIVTGNTCNNNSSHGIEMYHSDNNTIIGNTCNNNSSHGIYLTNADNNTITGNTCNNNSSHGIYLNYASNNTVTGNTCNNNSSHGIEMYHSDNNTVTGNICNNNYMGIDLSSTDNNNTVTGNTCNNNTNSGIYLYKGNNNTVTGNTCNNSRTNGIYLTNADNNTITGNTCIRGTGQSSDYKSSQYTIYATKTSNNNLFVGNNIMGKNYIDEGTGNTWANNKYN